MLATLYDVEISTINEHIMKILSDHELEAEATVRNFRIVQTEGTLKVNLRNIALYKIGCFNLTLID